MRFIPVDDLRIDRAAVVAPGEWNVIAASGGTPLILASPPDTDLRVIALTFDLADSDFPFHLGFPILVENTLSWFSGDTLPRVSGLGDITLPAGTTAVAGLDGTEYEVRTEAGEPHITVNEPDLVTALVDGRRVRIATNLVDPAISNVNAGTTWTLVKYGEHDHELVQVEHHFVHDGWSIALLLGEIRELYAAYSQGRPSPLPELEFQFADYSAWTTRSSRSASLAEAQRGGPGAKPPGGGGPWGGDWRIVDNSLALYRHGPRHASGTGEIAG
jgi:hypothetical protein